MRILAAIAAALSAFWPVGLLLRVRAASPRGGVAIVFGLLFVAVGVVVTVRFLGRARGRLLWTARGHRDPANLWTGMLLLNLVVYSSWVDWNKGALHRVSYVVAGLSVVLGIVGWRLEKKRGK